MKIGRWKMLIVGRREKMKNKNYLKYLNLAIFSMLFVLPLATALDQSFQMVNNITTQINISSTSQNFTITTEGGTFNYNLTNSTNTASFNFQRNVTCAYNTTEINTNVSGLYWVLQNISSSAAIIAKADADRSSYFESYTTCLANLSSAITNLSIIGAKQDFQSQYQQCVGEKTGLQGTLATIQNQLGNEPAAGIQGSGCRGDLKVCQSSQGNTNDLYIGIGLAGIAIGFFVCYQWKVKPKTGPDSLHNQSTKYD